MKIEIESDDLFAYLTYINPSNFGYTQCGEAYCVHCGEQWDENYIINHEPTCKMISSREGYNRFLKVLKEPSRN